LVRKILVVDDDRTLAETTAEILRVRGYEVFLAFDGYQVMSLAHRIKPDLIMLDVMMPAGGGIRAYQYLKLSSGTSTIPVIFATAVPFEDVVEKVGQIDSKYFVSKPYDVDMLVEKISGLIGS
jgi:DNA-binding response OmpR family regulator